MKQMVRLNLEFIESRLERMGIPSRARLAQMCGLTPQHLHEVLHSDGPRLRRTAIGTLWEISMALRCMVEDLIVFEETGVPDRPQKSRPRAPKKRQGPASKRRTRGTARQ